MIFWEGERELGGVLPPEILASQTKLKSLASSLSDATVNVGSIAHGRKIECITITSHDFLHWNHEQDTVSIDIVTSLGAVVAQTLLGVLVFLKQRKPSGRWREMSPS